MNEYLKIQTMFKRDLGSKHKTIVEGDWSIPEFEFLAGNTWVFTEKVDGTNIRVNIAPDGAVTFGGRTDAAQIPAHLIARLNERFVVAPQTALAGAFESGAILYGEGYGAKIQKGGGNYRPDADFVLFDVRVGEWWLNREDIEDIARKLGLDVVPIIGEGTLLDAARRAKDGIVSHWGAFTAEGIVARPKVELRTRAGHRLITKIKCRDFVMP